MAEILALDPAGDEPFLTRIENGVLTIELSAPPAHSLSLDMLMRLNEVFEAVRNNKDVSAIVVTSSGKIFCAGHDLREMKAHRKDADGGRAFLEELFRRCSQLMQAIVDSPKPVIAAVDGIATAAGCQLVASCDLAVASNRAQFCTPGVNLGGFCSTPMVALSRNLSPKHAMEMLLTGDLFDAQTAREFGLVNHVVAPEELNQVVRKLAETIASKSSSAIARGKRAFYRQLEMPLPQAYAFSSEVMVDGFMTRDAEEGIAAFFDKRDPEWE